MSDDLLDLMREAMDKVREIPGLRWYMNPTTLRALRRKSLRLRNGIPSSRRHTRAVHRAYRKLARG